MLQVLLNEAAEFGDQARRFVAGELDEETFRTFRLRRGIYGQRQPGFQMVRIKIPGGLVTADQMRAIGEVAEQFGHGIGHITTRQDVQIHFVALDRAQTMLEQLAHAGLTTREACGNSVRNVTVCAMAGYCPGQEFDVRPFGEEIARRFMRNPLTAALPRKFKISFSCSLRDCALGEIHDIGALAMVRDGKRGFRVKVGGGLGPAPHLAETLYDFLPAEQLGPVFDAILKVFDDHGNRRDKHRARLKFVVRQHGISWFREQVEKARATVLGEPWEVPADAAPLDGVPVPVRIPQGNLKSDGYHQIAAFAETYGDGMVRLTINQNLIISGVSQEKVSLLTLALNAAGFALDRVGELADVVTCPGAATCNLGITRSMDLGAELTRTLNCENDALARQMTIRISGCPNSCGHHHVGQIGFYGNVRKVEGDTVPYYQMLIGGGQGRNGMRLGKAVLSIPARLAPVAVGRIVEFYKSDRREGESFLDFADRIGVPAFKSRLSDLPNAQGEELLADWGQEEKFTLKLGRGECAT